MFHLYRLLLFPILIPHSDLDLSHKIYIFHLRVVKKSQNYVFKILIIQS